MLAGTKLVRGVGLNDADYVTQSIVDGKRSICPYYNVWRNMIDRCYSESYQKIQPTYVGCVICSEWLTFSKFKAWMQLQDWQGKCLDKDLLVIGNKIYSPDTCVFVTASINNFTIDGGSSRIGSMIGSHYDKRDKIFQSHCRNPITNKRENLGRYPTEIEAHLAWKRRKHELACQLADLQTDIRVSEALRIRYL